MTDADFLHSILELPDDDVCRLAFAEVCARRLLWRDHVANKRFGPAPTPAQRDWRTDKESVWLAASQLLHNAGKHAARHEGARSASRPSKTARKKRPPGCWPD